MTVEIPNAPPGYEEFVGQVVRKRIEGCLRPRPQAPHHSVIFYEAAGVGSFRFKKPRRAVADDLYRRYREELKAHITAPYRLLERLRRLRRRVSYLLCYRLAQSHWYRHKYLRRVPTIEQCRARLSQPGRHEPAGGARLKKASIVLLAYNRFEYLQNTLRSFFATQDYPNYELIVVDNGSTDGGVAYLKDLAGEGLISKLILRSRNHGTSAGFNCGFAYAAPDTIPAGLTRIRMSNAGKEHQHAQLARLRPGHGIEELRDTLSAGGSMPKWVTLVGGSGVPSPGQPSEVIVSLEAGAYALLCFVTSADGVPHLAKGMIRALTVVGPARAQPTPEAHARLVLHDYGFALTPGLAAGRRTIKVENIGPQPHEVEFVRLRPGKTAADILAWFRTHDGPPPGEPFGGTAALQTGEVNYVTGDFTRGDYALLCFVPDAGDGRRHVAHGMVSQIRVD